MIVHLKYSNIKFLVVAGWCHLGSRRNTATPSLRRTFCLFVLCLSVTLFFFFFAVLLSVSLRLWFELDGALGFRKAVIVLWKFNVPHGCLFFIIKYRSNNLAANGAPQQTGTTPSHCEDCSETFLIFTPPRSGKKNKTHIQSSQTVLGKWRHSERVNPAKQTPLSPHSLSTWVAFSPRHSAVISFFPSISKFEST